MSDSDERWERAVKTWVLRRFLRGMTVRRYDGSTDIVVREPVTIEDIEAVVFDTYETGYCDSDTCWDDSAGVVIEWAQHLKDQGWARAGYNLEEIPIAQIVREIAEVDAELTAEASR